MTVQIPDAFRLDGAPFSILGVHGGPLFAPAHLGWETEARDSSNWRGFVATYALAGDRLVLSQLSIRFSYDALDMTEPIFVIELREGERADVRHHRVHRQTERLGPPGEEDIDLALPGLARRHWLTHAHPDRFELSGPSRTIRIADGEEVELGPYRIRPRVASGFAALATSPLPRLLGYEGRWRERPTPNACYDDMASPIPFTGALLLCADLLEALYAYGGRPTPWRFGRVEELFFEEGALLDRRDRSGDMALVRARVAELPSPPPRRRPPVDRETRAEIEAWTKRCFESRYG